MQEYFINYTGLTLVASLAASAWTLFKSSELWERARARRFERALGALESAVEETYRTYVRAIKEARADGRLTHAEQRRARELARDRAMYLAREEGLDLLRELGEAQVNVWIAKLVRRLKRG